MGLIVSVYRRSGANNGGISDTVDHLFVVNVDGPFEPSDKLASFTLEGAGTTAPKLVPVDKPTGRVLGPMAGGNFAGTCDGRWRRAVGFYGAVSIHDRFETQETYNILST